MKTQLDRILTWGVPLDQAGTDWVARILDEVEAAEAREAELREHLMSWVAQYGCDCAHPACKRCRDTREVGRVLKPAREGAAAVDFGSYLPNRDMSEAAIESRSCWQVVAPAPVAPRRCAKCGGSGRVDNPHDPIGWPIRCKACKGDGVGGGTSVDGGCEHKRFSEQYSRDHAAGLESKLCSDCGARWTHLSGWNR